MTGMQTMTAMMRCRGCAGFSSADGWCRNCRPLRECQSFPPTCAPTKIDGQYVCCMEDNASD